MSALATALSAQADNEEHRAIGDNYAWDCRASDKLREDFERKAANPLPCLIDAHTDYFEDYVRNAPIPATLDAGLVEDMATGIEAEQSLVRLESIDWALNALSITLTQLQDAMPDGANPNSDFVDRFLSFQYDRGYRNLRFATFADNVADDIAHPDWPHRLRDRLGLAHLNPKKDPIKVALMRYPVKAISQELRSGAIALTVPTVFDSVPWPYFFPSPADCCYGRAMGLGVDHGEEALQAEVVGFAFRYKSSHLVKVGTIDKVMPDLSLKQLRNHHLLCLRLASGCHDYGTEWE